MNPDNLPTIELPKVGKKLNKKLVFICVGIVLLILILAGVAIALAQTVGYKQYKGNYYKSGTPTNTVQTTGEQGNNPNWNNPAIGMVTEAQNLPSCKGTNLFSSSIVDPSAIAGIEPLGHVSSYNGNVEHVLPVDHMYVDLKRISPQNSPTIVTSVANVYAPGDVEVYQVSDISHSKNGVVTDHDYTIYFAPCKEVTVYLGHIDTISIPIQQAILTAQKSCGSPFDMDGVTFTTCTYSPLLNLKGGDAIGSAGGSGHATVSFDFGVYDMRNKPLAFIDPKYDTPDNLQAVCGFGYYADGAVKTALFQKIENTRKNAQGLPDCGTNMQDLAGTLQGNWYLPNTPTNMGVPNDKAIVFIHQNTDPSNGIIDWGGTIALSDQIAYKPTMTGTIDREPSQVTPDGNMYCYQDTNYYMNGVKTGRSLFIQLSDANTLKVEYHAGLCPAHPAFANPTTYVR